jgi:thiamine biosynthesis lipoprotein
MVNAGGDIAISGLERSGDPWLISIDDPRTPGERLGLLQLGRCGLATSGQDYRRWTQGGVKRHHIIDPRTGRPAETDVLTASVVAPTILLAEMAAKVVFILGSQAGLAWLSAQPDMSGLVVTLKGEVILGEGMERFQVRESKPAVEY